MSNAKSELQEFLQKRGPQVPTYRTQSTGQSHYPTCVCTVTASYEGERYSERVEVRGGKKKDAEKLAAEKLLQRLRSLNGGTQSQRQRGREEAALKERFPMASPRQNGYPELHTRDGATTPAAASSRSSSPRTPPPGDARSPVSILQERLQATSLSLPRYIEGRSPSLEFRVKCVVSGGRRVLESRGDGPSKRTAKDAAAREMLRQMETGGDAASVDGVVDHELTEDITASLAPHSPQYHYWYNTGEVRKWHMCI